MLAGGVILALAVDVGPVSFSTPGMPATVVRVLEAQVRVAADATPDAIEELSAAIGAIEETTRAGTPAVHYEQAWLELALGRPRPAAERFESLRWLGPEDRMHDWQLARARAWLEVGRSEGDPMALVRALDSLAPDPTPSDVWSDLREALGLGSRDGPERCSHTEGPPIDAIRCTLDEHLLQWARALGTPSALAFEERLERWSTELLHRGDGTLAELAATARRATSGDGAMLALLSRLAASETAYSNGECQVDPTLPFELGATSPILAAIAELRLTVCRYFSDVEAVDERLERLRSHLAGLPAPWVSGQVEWLAGVAAVSRNEPARGSTRLQKGVDLLANLGEPASEAGALASLAEARLRSGEVEVALGLLQTSVRLAARSQVPSRHVNALLLLAMTSREAGFPGAAELVDRMALETARSRGIGDRQRAAVLARAAEAAWAASRDVEASELLDEAERVLNHADDAVAKRIRLDAALARAIVGIEPVEESVLEELHEQILATGQRERARLAILARARRAEPTAAGAPAMRELELALAQPLAEDGVKGSDPIGLRLASEAVRLSLDDPFSAARFGDAMSSRPLLAEGELRALLGRLSMSVCWLQLAELDDGVLVAFVGRGPRASATRLGVAGAAWRRHTSAVLAAMSGRFATEIVEGPAAALRTSLGEALARGGCSGHTDWIVVVPPALSFPTRLVLERARASEDGTRIAVFPSWRALATAVAAVREPSALRAPTRLLYWHLVHDGEEALPEMAAELTLLRDLGGELQDEGSAPPVTGAWLHMAGHRSGFGLVGPTLTSLPAFVFLNLCGGPRDGHRGGPLVTDGIVSEWLLRGVAVLAPAIDVGDRAASAIAKGFYSAAGDLSERLSAAAGVLRTSSDPDLAHPASWAGYELWGFVAPDWVGGTSNSTAEWPSTTGGE